MARDIKQKNQKFSKEANDKFVKERIAAAKRIMRKLGKPLKCDTSVVIEQSKMNKS